jgi:Flp pilus assembly protein TadG
MWLAMIRKLRAGLPGINRRYGRKAARGQALIETAVALPIILMLSLAAFDLGRGIVAHIALTEATQDGAFFAAYELGDAAVGESQVEDRVTTSSNAPAVADAIVDVTSGDAPDCATPPGSIVVTSTYDLPVTSPPAIAIFGSTFTLTVQISATNFNEDCS